MQRFIKEYYTKEGKLYRVSDNKEVGWLCNGRYLMFDHGGKKYLVHRAIFLIHYGFLPDMIDHEDRNKVNNKPSNLRPTNKEENARNSGLRSDNTSGFKGVSKHRDKWFSYYWIKGERINIGYHNSPEEANEARENFINSIIKI